MGEEQCPLLFNERIVIGLGGELLLMDVLSGTTKRLL